MITRKEIAELMNLYHLARTALADSGHVPTRYERTVWAVGQFVAEHADIPGSRAYKELDGALR